MALSVIRVDFTQVGLGLMSVTNVPLPFRVLTMLASPSKRIERRTLIVEAPYISLSWASLGSNSPSAYSPHVIFISMSFVMVEYRYLFSLLSTQLKDTSRPRS